MADIFSTISSAIGSVTNLAGSLVSDVTGAADDLISGFGGGALSMVTYDGDTAAIPPSYVHHKNSAYLARLVQKSTGISVWGNVPEPIAVTLQNDWESLLSVAEGGNTLTGGIQKIIQATSGLSLFSQQLSAQVYKGTRPFGFRVPMLFTAEKNPIAEIVMPVRNLFKLASPEAKSGDSKFIQFLRSPGPTVYQFSKEGYRAEKTIQFGMGQTIFFPSVVIESLNFTYVNLMLAKTKIPMVVTVDVNLRGFVAATVADIANIVFPGKGNNEGISNASNLFNPQDANASGGGGEG